MSSVNSHRPSGPDPLREFLRARLTPEQIRIIASADWDIDGDRIALELWQNLQTGQYTYQGEGNIYEVATMQAFYEGKERPLFELFGAWWLATFCSTPDLWHLIDNLDPLCGPRTILAMLCRGCGTISQDASRAAHAALPLVSWLQQRDPTPSDQSHCPGIYEKAERTLEAIERQGEKAVGSGRWQEFFAA